MSGATRLGEAAFGAGVLPEAGFREARSETRVAVFPGEGRAEARIEAVAGRTACVARRLRATRGFIWRRRLSFRRGVETTFMSGNRSGFGPCYLEARMCDRLERRALPSESFFAQCAIE